MRLLTCSGPFSYWPWTSRCLASFEFPQNCFFLQFDNPKIFQSVTDEDSAAANIYLSHYLPEGRANFTAANAAEIARMMGDVRYTGPIHMGVELLKDTVEKPLYYYMYR